MDELVRRWARGWVLCRGVGAALERDFALEVRLGLPGRERELFALTDDAEIVNELAVRTAKSSDTWLTVTTGQPAAKAAVLEQAGLRLLDEPCLLMTIELRKHPDTTAPPGYGLETTSDGPLEYVKVKDGQGNVAARGMAAVVGDDAVLHDIQTDPAHRRRGLGSVVMNLLSARATDRGAATGLLMATTDGGYLYPKLGWSTEATMITAVS
ncbi:GNAT family N-acetyltransferase [Kribbella ginsengisoli]|uniref:N-acetyltransferase domain-containing protein n=1 Tax=Kribbella ginsengisoli TaxID=363865 RepID=A0ABP6Y7F3_9ACTN